MGSAFLHQLRRDIGSSVIAEKNFDAEPTICAGRQSVYPLPAARYWVQRHRWWSVRQELNLRTYGRSVLLYPLSYGQMRAEQQPLSLLPCRVLLHLLLSFCNACMRTLTAPFKRLRFYLSFAPGGTLPSRNATLAEPSGISAQTIMP